MIEINSDLLDAGLQAVMGKDRCQDVTEQMKKNPKPTPAKKVEQEKAKAATTGTLDAEWMKLNTVSPMAKLKGCVKGVWLYGGISLLLFWWQQAGLLASEAAVPSFVVLALLAGVQIGSICRG